MTQLAEIDERPIFVGRDILELLSSAMYVDPLTIYREYMQNAVDAIDEAVAKGLLRSIEDGVIEINADHLGRRMVIRDNGIGLANVDFVRKMMSFGASQKRGTSARGFRGVGRLSGLGYTQELVFRSKTDEDAEVLETIWNGQTVKRLLSSMDSDAGLDTIVQESTTVRRMGSEGYPPRFFEVELRRPRRIANDKLLNEAEIELYLSQSCPCPFSPEFSYGREIAELLAPHGGAGQSYKIFLNGAETPIYRPYRDTVTYSETRSAALGDLETFEIEGLDGKLAAVGWVIHHDYQGMIPVAQGIRGLSARVGNVQIGGDRLFSEVFPEDRFCSWTIGEVHVLDSRIVPNGRRDDFEVGGHMDNILAHLRPVAAKVAHRCRISSRRRNRIKAFDLSASKIEEKLNIIRQGAVSQGYAREMMAEIGALLSQMNKDAKFELFAEEEKAELRSRYDEIEELVKVCACKADLSILDNLPDDRRELYKEIFDLIYDCSVNHVAAKSLIDRMLDRLSRQ